MQSLQYQVDLQLPGIRYYDLFGCLAALRTHGLQFSNNIHPFDDFSEHDVFSVEPACLGTGDEELAAVSVGARICHR